MVRRGRGQNHAVRDVSFEAYFGEILFIVGPSGSGKTTMLSMVSGILRPNGGKVKIEGTDIWGFATTLSRSSVCTRSASSSRTTTCFPA